MGSEKYISTRFREMFKLFKSAKKQQSFQWLDALSEQVLGKWMHFQIYLSLWVAGDQRLVLRKGCNWKIFEEIVNVTYLKKLANFIGKHLFWSLFLIKLQAREPNFLFFLIKLQASEPNFLFLRFQNNFSSEICEIFKSTCFEEHLWISGYVSSGNLVYNAWENKANEA